MFPIPYLAISGMCIVKSVRCLLKFELWRKSPELTVTNYFIILSFFVLSKVNRVQYKILISPQVYCAQKDQKEQFHERSSG